MNFVTAASNVMTFSEMFSDSFYMKIFGRVLIVGVLVALCASLLGVSLVLKRFSMIGDGLSHVGFGALALATLFAIDESHKLEFTIPIVVIAAFFLLRISENSKIKGDSAIALFSTSAMAIGYIIYNVSSGGTADVCNNLFSSASITSITDKDLIISVVLSIVVIFLFVFFYTKIFTVTFDENFSKATGVRPGFYNLMIALLTAVTIVLGIRMTGAIMIPALVVFPALTSMRFFRSFLSVVISSAVISVVCFVIGFVFGCRLSLPTGPCVVVTNLVAFVIFSVIGKTTRRV
ncbi:MAG: metal ABC transporter permease [Acutalibacteraceae bacterium]